jgi:hypothetical protein
MQGIWFADAFLLQEDSSKLPSQASSVADYIGEPSGILWLIEKRRPSSFIRWSRTLNHSALAQSDLRSLTIYSFAHFTMGHSNNTLVLADLQGEKVLCRMLFRIFLISFSTGSPAQIDGHNSFT